MKSRFKQVGFGAAIAAVGAAGLQAEVKINDNLSLDGYAIGSGVVTEGTGAKNYALGKSAFYYDSAYIAVNGTYKDFTSKVSLYAVSPFADNTGDDTGVLDAYVTYKTGNVAITGGKYLGWLGYESFHSPNNAFISFGQSLYASPWATGAKIDYSGDGFSTGISVRDSQIAPGGGFFEGDGEFSDDIGYETYFLYTGVEKLTLFAGAGYEDVEGGDQIYTLNAWGSYAVTDKFSVAAEYATVEDTTDYTWLLQGTYAVTEKLSVAARTTGFEGDNGNGDAFGYGLASTYTITPNFSVKSEVTKTDYSTASDAFSYAIQGLFRF